MTYSLPAVLALLMLIQTPVSAQQLDPNDPQDALIMQRKIFCSLEDGEPTTFWWHGKAFSRRQGERDIHLFNVEGMNVRTCVADEHPERGKGFRLISRELLLYRDPETNEVMATWSNPWTGETVDVLHVANDPVNGAFYEIGSDGKPFQWSGRISEGQWRQTTTVPLFYPNPLGGGFQKQVGGTYHATEMFNFLGRTDDLLDSQTTMSASHVGWVRLSDWLPWMNMEGREGVIYMHTAGLRMSSWDAMPNTMKNEIAEHYPDYVAPPPLDDSRPNVTSWEYYRRVAEGEEEVPQLER